MDAPSSSSSDFHAIKQDGEEEEEPIVKRKTLPYHSLLLHLHTLEPQHEFWTSRAVGVPFYSTVTRQETWNVLQEMKFQQMIFMLLRNHGVTSQSIDDIRTMAEAKAKQIRNFLTRYAYSGPSMPPMVGIDELNYIPKFMEASNQKIKPRLKEFCLRIVHLLLQGNSSTTGTSTGECYGVFGFINVILFRLKHFKKLKPNLFDPVKKQMDFLEQMLNYAPIIVSKMANLDENLQNFFKFFEPWVNTATAIVILYWLDENDEKPFAMVSSSLQKFNLNFLQYVKAYILVIKALRASNASEILVMRNTVEQLIEMILEKFNLSVDDRFDMFREGLAFWTALLVDLPNSDTEHEKLICSRTHLLVDQAESLICSLCLCKHVAENRNTLLNGFLEKISEAKTEIRQLQVHQIPGLSCNNALKANTKRHFDLLLANVQKKFEVEAGFLPFENHLIAIVHGELSHLRPYLLDIFELQDGHKDLRDICVQASNIAYFVDYITDFCLVSTDIPIWSNLMHLYNAIEKIQSIKIQVSNIRQDDQMYNDIVMSAKLNSQCVLPTRHEVYDATINDDFMVGFVEEEKRIIDCLVAGEAGLEIVAVIGMGGQGKTHLARRVFQDKSINLHFYKLASCCISQAYDIKKVFKDILEGVGENVSTELYQSLTQEDLADKLRKCLMGQKYLIFLDDMWDAKAWFDFQESFPDNRNGSRILVTSRIHDVALKAKANCSIVELYPLSHEESWKLLQTKVFHKDCCPPTLIEIGKALAKNCKGLPLAIVVVAGLLKKDKNSESWKNFCESLKPLIASEGCMDIVELSYTYLPDYLKPCFLYLGTFKEDEKIDANRLIQYWIAEGFVQSDGIKARKVVAKEYMMDLASRNLISIVSRSSRNQIKWCVVHDLLHQLCRIKFEEERFMLILNNMLLDGASTINNDYYRISVDDKWGLFVDSKPIIPGLRSLIVFLSTSVDVSGVVKELKLIRILDLRKVVLTKAGFHSITQLIHLRLLAVNCSFRIPPSILNLLKLEVLHITSKVHQAVILPHAVLKMPSLRYIYAGFCKFAEVGEFVRADIFSPLSKLESLGSICFYRESSFKEVAQSLQNILKLDISCSFYFHLSSYFKRLESLELNMWCREEQYVVISPSVLDFPLTLKKLSLTLSKNDKRGARLSGAMISLIGKLPNLEVLKLEAQFENDRWYVEDDEFLQLKYFSLSISSIKEWNVCDESFPFLQQLIVRYCRKLGELPDRFGSVTTLRRIKVYNCSHSLLDSFQQIVDDQMDAGNEGLQHDFFDFI